jgi:tetratricopeptide (TPR) repeat protein
MKYAIKLIVLLLLLMTSVTASNDGGTTSPFSFGAGARSLSLGGSDMATGDVATAPFWNASRLARAERFALTGFHSNLYDSDVTYQYFGLVFPTLDFGSFGLGVFRLGVGGIEKRDAGNLLLGEFDDSRLGFYLAYGRNISGYDVGLAGTMEHHSLDEYKATSSPGLNLSISRRFELRLDRLKYISVAINGRNLIEPSFKLVDESVKYPRALTGGLSVSFLPNPGWDQTATISATLEKINWVDPRLSLGVEYSFGDLLHLRGGSRDGSLSAGVGLGYRAVKFDYALVDRDLGSLHTFSVTTVFGTPVSEKREINAREREAKFNRLMSDQLLTRNREMVSTLVQEGKAQTDAGDLIEAAGSLDRALFLARSANLDTVQIHELTLEVENQLKEAGRLERFEEYLDTAAVRLEAGDYLLARHFANLAIGEEPNSEQAHSLLATANAAIEKLTSREKLIQRHLHTIDSLLGYGRVEQALVIADGLRPFASDNPSIALALRRVSLERWKSEADAARSREDYAMAVMLLDSALAVFPGHQWCLELRNRIVNTRAQTVPVSTTDEQIPSEEPISDQLRKEVDAAYRAAQVRFEQGELPEAIELWEKVERLAPRYLSVREYLVKAYKFVGVDLYSQSRLEDAVAVWGKAVRLDPGNSEILRYIDRTKTEIRKTDELSYEY